jgi:hypothetical protein
MLTFALPALNKMRPLGIDVCLSQRGLLDDDDRRSGDGLLRGLRGAARYGDEHDDDRDSQDWN